MAFLGETYETANMPESSFDVIPAGWYDAIISEADLKDTKNGSGKYIKLQFDIVGPSYQGRKIFGNINIKNHNPKAEEIGRQQLGDIMRAIGLPHVYDTDQLVSGRLMIKVSVRAETEEYPAQNEVKGFKAVSSSSVPTPSFNQPAAPPTFLPPSFNQPAAPPSEPAVQDKNNSLPPWAAKK